MLSIERLSIEAVLLVRLAKLCDVRGYFLESYNARAFAEAGIDVTFVQDNQSLSVEPGTIRSLHFQTPPEAQAKHIRVLRGSIFDAAVDLRKGSKTYGQWCAANLSGQARSKSSSHVVSRMIL